MMIHQIDFPPYPSLCGDTDKARRIASNIVAKLQEFLLNA